MNGPAPPGPLPPSPDIERGARSRSPALAVAALVLFAQAWLSQGYFHPDEYFQTVEFASYKLGVTAQAELPWEFAERMRPFLQPATYYALARA